MKEEERRRRGSIGSLKAGFVTERSELGSCRAFSVQYPILNEVDAQALFAFRNTRTCEEEEEERSLIKDLKRYAGTGQSISGCRGVRNLSPTGAVFLFHDVRLFDPERRSARGPPRKCLGMCRRVTNTGESGFGIANGRVAVSVEQYYGEPLNPAKGPLHGSVLSSCEDSVLRGWEPKGPVGSPDSFPSALNKRGGSWPSLPLVELIQKSMHQHLKLKCKKVTERRFNKSTAPVINVSLSFPGLVQKPPPSFPLSN